MDGRGLLFRDPKEKQKGRFYIPLMLDDIHLS